MQTTASVFRTQAYSFVGTFSSCNKFLQKTFFIDITLGPKYAPKSVVYTRAALIGKPG